MSASSSSAARALLERANKQAVVRLSVTTKRLDIDEVRGRSRYFVRYFAVNCEARVDMVDIANRTPAEMLVDVESVRRACGGRLAPHFGGCVYARVLNEDRRMCVTQIGSFYTSLASVMRAGAANVTLPVENYSLADSLRGQGGRVSSRQGSIAFTVNTVSAPADFDAASLGAESSKSIDSVNETVFMRYIKPFYDICIGESRRYEVSQRKLIAYHVPNFVTYSGAQLPASASLLWRPYVSSWRPIDAAIRDAARVAVASYPEITSFNRYLELLEQMTDTHSPLRRLSSEHSAALRASVEVLTQLSTVQPYLEDFAFGKDRNGRVQKIGDDQYCPVTETDGTDCEDGAQYACQLKRIIEIRSSVIPSLSRLYSYFAHCVAIMYCADDEPEQSERDQGLCHVVCVLIPRSAQITRYSSARVPSELLASDHWIRRVGLIVPETTAITDCRVYPGDESDERIRVESEKARNLALGFTSPSAGTYMNRDTFVSRRRGQGSAKYIGGYYASGFYQWITNLWTDECPRAIDLLPTYARRRWGVRVRDLSAQILLENGALSQDTMRKYYGDETLSRIRETPIELVYRVELRSEMRALFADVLCAHVPPYKLLPDEVPPTKVQRVESDLVRAAKSRSDLVAAMRAVPRDRRSYVRLDLYATDFYTPGVSSGESRASEIMSNLDRLVESNCGFYAARMLVTEVYRGRSAIKITILLFYDQSRLDCEAARHIGRRGRNYSKRGNFN